MSLLVIDNIVKEYRNKCVLNGVSLRVERGERLALIGPNGAGKTTLIKIAMGIEYSDSGSVTIARNTKVGYLSQDLKDVATCEGGIETAVHYEKAFRLEKKIRDIEQKMADPGLDHSSDLYRDLMNEYSKLIIRYEAMDGYTIETKITKTLLGLGLRKETLDTPVDKLSGGEKMRVSVARILLEEPDLLILDEPTNHLDIQATEWFEDFLKSFEGGILFVSHDRYFLDRVATRVAELENGTVCTRSGNYSDYMEHKKQMGRSVINEQRRLKWVLKNANETAMGLKSRGRIRALKSREKEIEKLNDELKINIEAAKRQDHLRRADGPKIRFKKIKHVSKDIAWAENLRKSFNDVALFSSASFHIRGGERIGIIGPNGCGKSTLINMLLGNDRDYQGFLRLGEWVKYSYMGQDVLFENDDLTVLQLIISKREMQEREARDHLSKFQFYGDDVDKVINVLSGGERVRLYLACVMLEDSDCLILDEPTNHLDVPARDAVEASLEEFKGTIIAVTHDRYYLTHCVDKILEIENGLINTYEGNYDFYRRTKYGVAEEANTGKAMENCKPARKGSNNKKNVTVSNVNTEKDIDKIEIEISELEAKAKSMEEQFDKDTSPEKYKEYDDLLKEIEGLYNLWDETM